MQQYFSTLERLRLAQGAVPRTSPRCCDRESARPSRPSLSRNSSYFRGPSSQRLRKTPSPENDFSQADAQWFLRLPETVQRKHFTKEEQHLLAGHCESVIVDATDEALYRRGRQANRSVPTLRTSYSTDTSTSSLCSSEAKDHIDSAVDMDGSLMDSFRWMEDDSGLDLTLDDYHKHIIDSAKPATKAVTRKPSFRRTLSLTNMPFCGNLLPSSTAFQRTVTPTQLPRPTARDVYERTSRPQRTDVMKVPPKLSPDTATDPATRHYQDPEARLKLRVYLASAQKFDEAVEFGFPALEEKKSPARRPSISRQHRTAPTVLTFYNDDTVSLFDTLDNDDDDGDTASLPEQTSNNLLKPTATTPNNLNHQTPSSKPSANTSRNPFATLAPGLTPTEPYPQLLSGSREMTLRMTLTRPDLRANNVGVRYAKGDDPFALEQLPPVTQGQDIWGTPTKSSGIRKLWRKVSGGKA